MKKKSVGLMTISQSENYGACLQMFALYYYLKNNYCEDLDVSVINYLRSVDSYTHQLKTKPLGTIKQIISDSILRISTLRSQIKRHKSFSKFRKQIRFTKTYSSKQQLENNPPVFDLYITGSDQVWCCNRNFDIEPYFLTFAKNNCKKISYAPSLSLEEIPNEWERRYRDWLKEYEAITVRERSDAILLNKLLDIDTVFSVLDPTFLLSLEQWDKFLPETKSSEKYIAIYSIGFNSNLMHFAIELSQKLCLRLKYINPTSYHYLISKDYDSIVSAGPFEFVELIRNATYILTDSYHGLIFATLYNVPFKVDTHTYSTRFKELVDRFSLEDNIIDYENINYEFKKISNEQIKRIRDSIDASKKYLDIEIQKMFLGK